VQGTTTLPFDEQSGKYGTSVRLMWIDGDLFTGTAMGMKQASKVNGSALANPWNNRSEQLQVLTFGRREQPESQAMEGVGSPLY